MASLLHDDYSNFYIARSFCDWYSVAHWTQQRYWTSSGRPKYVCTSRRRLLEVWQRLIVLTSRERSVLLYPVSMKTYCIPCQAYKPTPFHLVCPWKRTNVTYLNVSAYGLHFRYSASFLVRRYSEHDVCVTSGLNVQSMPWHTVHPITIIRYIKTLHVQTTFRWYHMLGW